MLHNLLTFIFHSNSLSLCCQFLNCKGNTSTDEFYSNFITALFGNVPLTRNSHYFLWFTGCHSPTTYTSDWAGCFPGLRQTNILAAWQIHVIMLTSVYSGQDIRSSWLTFTNGLFLGLSHVVRPTQQELKQQSYEMCVQEKSPVNTTLSDLKHRWQELQWLSLGNSQWLVCMSIHILYIRACFITILS